MPKVSDDHKAEIRARLLDAAQVVVERTGCDGLTTRDVTTEAGLAAGTLYHYFANKDELILALAQRSEEEMLHRLLAGEAVVASLGDSAAASGAGPNSGTDVLARILTALFSSDEEDLLLQLRNRAIRDEAVAASMRRYNRHMLEGLRPFVLAAQREGTIRADLDADALIEMVVVFWEGLSQRRRGTTLQTSFERIGLTFLSTLLDGVSADAAARARFAAGLDAMTRSMPRRPTG